MCCSEDIVAGAHNKGLASQRLTLCQWVKKVNAYTALGTRQAHLSVLYMPILTLTETLCGRYSLAEDFFNLLV